MMQRWHTLTAVALINLSSAPAVPAGPLNLNEQVEAFSICAGRLSALGTRQRATHDPQSEMTGRLTANFEDLLEATLPFALASGVEASAPRRWRATGWSEIAGLLSRQYHSGDARSIARAQADISRRITTCERMVLAG